MRGAVRFAATSLSVMACLVLLSCDSAEDQAFMSECQAKRGFSEAQCSCVKDLINDGLEDKGRSYVKAVVVQDQAAAARIQSTFGIIEGATILARASWIATNAPQACGVQI